MPNKLYYPQIVESLDSQEIPFSDGDVTLDSVSNITTQRPVLGIAHSSGRLTVEGSQSLVFRKFSIPPGLLVQGLELELTVDRLARIQDRVIQLWYQGSAQGQNRADLSAANFTVYGGAEDLWTASGIDFSSDSFGVVIDLQPHTQYPSSNLIYFRSLALRVYS